MGKIEGNEPARDNDWETVKKGGEQAIKNWIDGQMKGRSCALLLIGSQTAGRKWIKYEIKQAWDAKKGLVGIHIHNLLDKNQSQTAKGANPFQDFTVGSDNKPLNSIVKSYDPPFTSSKDVYAYISANLEKWVDEAIRIRNNFV